MKKKFPKLTTEQVEKIVKGQTITLVKAPGKGKEIKINTDGTYEIVKIKSHKQK